MTQIEMFGEEVEVTKPKRYIVTVDLVKLDTHDLLESVILYDGNDLHEAENAYYAAVNDANRETNQLQQMSTCC